MRPHSPAPPMEETTKAPRPRRSDAAVIAQYIQDLSQDLNRAA
jgi:hypothetical protein